MRRARQPPPVLDHPGPAPGLIHPPTLFARRTRIPARVVLTYFPEALEALRAAGRLRPLLELRREGTSMPFYAWGAGDTQVVVGLSGVGAPLAVMVLEELMALGGRTFVSVGGAGALDGRLAPGLAFLPSRALRGEGVSQAYQARGRWSRPDRAVLQALAAACLEAKLACARGAVWTTDAVYRETPALVRRRQAEGCRVVDMEAAALFAAARFRGARLAALLYAGDDVSGPRWRPRRWNQLVEVRTRLLGVALRAVRGLEAQ